MTEQKKLSKSTIQKLRAIKEAILDQPELYDQDMPPSYAFFHGGGCGAPCCIAGWAAWLDNPDPKVYAHRVKTMDGKEMLVTFLGLDSEQANRLYWKTQFNGVLVDSAELGAERIEHFIKTDGRE